MNSRYKTIVVSDVHLGTKSAKAKELVRFLRDFECEKLILNGDIIDAWQLKKFGEWKKRHTRFFKLIMTLLEESETKVIYLRGNHDDFLDEFIPFEFGNFCIVKEYIHETGNKKYYVCHGDVFDAFSSKFMWVAKLGDIGYTFLLWMNRVYNNRRIKRGLPYYSLSKAIKNKVKKAVSFISDFEVKLAELAKQKKCDGVICGHIHHPANKMINGIHYLNSGDWIESLTALGERYDGTWDILTYDNWLEKK